MARGAVRAGVVGAQCPAAGRVTLRRGKHAGVYAVREIPAAEAGPVLKKYVAIAGATRSYFKATEDSPVAEFVAEGAVHPVFELTPPVTFRTPARTS